MNEQDQTKENLSDTARARGRPLLTKFQHFEIFSLAIGAGLAAIGALIAAGGGMDISLVNGWSSDVDLPPISQTQRNEYTTPSTATRSKQVLKKKHAPSF